MDATDAAKFAKINFVITIHASIDRTHPKDSYLPDETDPGPIILSAHPLVHHLDRYDLVHPFCGYIVHFFLFPVFPLLFPPIRSRTSVERRGR